MKAPSRSTLAVYVACVASLALPGQAAAAAYTVNASQDTFVDSANAGVSMGTGSLANIDYNGSGDQRIALVKFTVPTLAAGETVNNVKLRVNVVNPGAASTAAYAVGTGWSETTTWNTRPSIGSKLSASSGAVPTGWFTYDLGKPLTQGGTYAFAIQTTGSDGVQFTTRENTSTTPAQLVVSTSVTTYRTVKLEAAADTYVDSAAPSTSMVAEPLVNVDYNSASDQRIALLRFDVPTLAAGESITDSKLRINVDNPGGGATAVYQAGAFANDATWKTRPSIGTKLTATSGAVPTGWFIYGLGTAISTAGTHSLAIQTTNSDGVQFTSRSSGQPAELELTIASTSSSTTTAPPASPTPTTPAPTSSKPTSSNTGFLGDATKLKRYNGDFTASTNGQVVEGLDVYGRVIVKANNVTIRNSIIRGVPSTSTNIAKMSTVGMVQAWDDNTGLVIENVTFKPQHKQAYQDGIRVQQATIRNVNISGTVDGVGVQTTKSGQSTRIENSWIGNLYVAAVPKSVHDDLLTHNDGLQMHAGAYRITVTNSNLNGAAGGAAIMMAARATTSGTLTATKSWFGGGGCSINIVEKDKGAYSGVSITNNVFARGTTSVKDCAIVAGSATKSKWTASGNKFDDGTAITSSFGIK